MNYVKSCIESGNVSYRGENTKQFEKVLSDYVGAYVVATNSGSAALQLGLKTLNIVQKKIICPTITYIASANAIVHSGNYPVFADCCQRGLTISIGKLEKLIQKTGPTAIMPVWTLGSPPPLGSILSLAKKYNLYIIEDSCQALGSFNAGQHAGTIGDCGALSFNGNKILTTGGGGAFITRSRVYYEVALSISMQCRKETERAEHCGIGHNWRMPALNASLGLEQWEQKKEWFMLQKKGAQDVSSVSNDWMVVSPDGVPIWQPLHNQPSYAACERDQDMSGADVIEGYRIKRGEW